MADGGARRRRVAGERLNYEQALERLADFVDDELGNGRQARQRPDDREWKIQRTKTIRILNELKEKLDKICVGANYGKAVGNGAEILGITGTIIGAIMSLRGSPSSQLVMNTGNLVQNTGTLIDGASSVVESLVSANYLSDIEAVLKKDKELSEPLAEWLDFSNDLDANVEQIFGVSLASEKMNIVFKVFYEVSKIASSVTDFYATLRLMRQGKFAVHIGTDVKVEKLQKFFQKLSTSPQLGNRMRVTLSVLSVSMGAIQGYRSGVKVYRYFKGISVSSAVPTYLVGGIPTVRQVSVFCVFQTISLAVSVISLMNAASIIRHGKSKYSDAIKQLVDALTSELRRMEEL